MATKKNNTKKEANKPEIKEEIVEELEELTNEKMAEIARRYDEDVTNFLKKQGLDDQTIEKVLRSEELGDFVEALMLASKPSLKERAIKFATDKKEAIKNTAIVIGITGAIVGVTYAVCSVADDDVENTENDIENDIVTEFIETTDGTLKITTELVNDEAEEA